MVDFRQKELEEWQIKNFSKGETGDCDRCPFRMMVGMIEEIGEAAHWLLKLKQGIRGVEQGKAIEEIADGVCDSQIYGIQLLSGFNVDAEKMLDKVIEHVLSRNWKDDPENGMTATEHKT